MMARLQLLHLIGRENGSKLLPGLLADSVHLLLRDHWGDGGVALQCRDLLIAVGEDGLELGRLIGGEVQLLAETGGLTLGTTSMVGLRGCWDRGGIRLLCEDESSGEG